MVLPPHHTSILTSDNSVPMSFEEVATCSPLCAVSGVLSISASGSAVCMPLKLRPRVLFPSVLSPRAEHSKGGPPAVPQGKRASVPAPQLPRILPLPS